MIRSILSILIALSMNYSASEAFTAENYVGVSLPKGVKIQMPRNWEILSNNSRISLDSFLQAKYQPLGMYDASSDLNFAANCYDDAGKTVAMLNTRYYPDIQVTQADVRAASKAEVDEFDATIRSGVIQGTQVSGYSILRWYGTTKDIIDGKVVLITEYERSPTNDNGNFRVRLIRILNGSSSFTLMISYRVRNENLFRAICDRVIRSLEF